MTDSFSRRSWLGLAGVAVAGATLAACDSSSEKGESDDSTPTPSFEPRATITDPDVALDELRRGNERYVAAEMEHPGQHPKARVAVAGGQEPFATIVSCSDSRVPPELLVDQGFGDLFVVRVAGNVIGRSELGSVEFAVGALRTPLVVVVGHQSCGAVDATIDSVEHGTRPEGAIADIVDLIAPAVPVAKSRPGDDLLDKAVRANAELARDTLAKSPVLAKAVQAGKLKVVAAYYDLKNGKFEIL